MHYRIRLDEISGLNTDDLLEICEPVVHVIVRHELPHGNPHYHSYIETSVKENTLRQRIKRKFPDIKSSDYSIKKCDEQRINEYVQYMFNTKHGNKFELYSVDNFDNQLLNTLKENAKNISDEYSALNSAKQSKGPTIWDIAQEVEQLVNKKLTVNDLGTRQLNEYVDMDEITKIRTYTDIAIDILRKYRKPFDEFLLRKVISTAMSSTEKGKTILRQKMLNNFLPR